MTRSRPSNRLAIAAALTLLLVLLVPTPASAHPEACGDKAEDSEA